MVFRGCCAGATNYLRRCAGLSSGSRLTALRAVASVTVRYVAPHCCRCRCRLPHRLRQRTARAGNERCAPGNRGGRARPGATAANSPDLYAAQAAIASAEKHLEAQEYVRARLAAQQAKRHATEALANAQQAGRRAPGRTGPAVAGFVDATVRCERIVLAQVTRRFRITGRVQGVYFRHSTRLEAERLALRAMPETCRMGRWRWWLGRPAAAVEQCISGCTTARRGRALRVWTSSLRSSRCRAAAVF